MCFAYPPYDSFLIEKTLAKNRYFRVREVLITQKSRLNKINTFPAFMVTNMLT